MENCYEVQFTYSDRLSNYEERKQSCSVYAKTFYEAEERCIELYGSGIDCDYKIISVRKIG